MNPNATAVSAEDADQYPAGTVVLSSAGTAYQRAPSPEGRPAWWLGGWDRPVTLRPADGPFRVLYEVVS